jgi:hypothetical protein
MRSFFKSLVGPTSRINAAALTEVKKTFVEVERLRKSSSADDVVEALCLISEIEKKHPFCYDVARIYRGETVASLVRLNDLDEQKKNTDILKNKP